MKEREWEGGPVCLYTRLERGQARACCASPLTAGCFLPPSGSGVGGAGSTDADGGERALCVAAGAVV